MYTSEDMSEMKVRVALLEAAHLDNTSKITTLIEGFNSLNVNLSSLIASIHTVIKTVSTGAALLSIVTGGCWAYYTFSVEHPIQTPYSITQPLGK